MATTPIIQVGAPMDAGTVINATQSLADALKATLGTIETYAEKLGAHPAADWTAFWQTALGPAPVAANPQAPTPQEQVAITQYGNQVANLTALATFVTTLATKLSADLQPAMTDAALLGMLHEANSFTAR